MKRWLSFVAALLLVFPLLFSCACQNVGSGNGQESTPETDENGLPVVDDPILKEALRIYFRLSPEEELTVEMLEKVTSVSIFAGINPYSEGDPDGEKMAGKVLLDVYINDDWKFGGSLPGYTEKWRFEEELKKIEDQIIQNRYRAFFELKDPEDPTLSNREKLEMLTAYPEAEQGAIYIEYPRINRSEFNWLTKIRLTIGVLDKWLYPEGEYDCSAFSCLPNLKTVCYDGISLSHLPSGVEAVDARFTTGLSAFGEALIQAGSGQDGRLFGYLYNSRWRMDRCATVTFVREEVGDADWLPEGKMLLSVYLNEMGSREYFDDIITVHTPEHVYRDSGAGVFPLCFDDEEAFETFLATIEDETLRQTVREHYRYMEYPSAETEEEREKVREEAQKLLEEVQKTTPWANFNCYFLLVETGNERGEVLDALGRAGLLDRWIVPEGEIDCSRFSILEDLSYIRYEGDLSFSNIPDGVQLLNLLEQDEYGVYY